MLKRTDSQQRCDVLVAEDDAHDQLLFALAVDDSDGHTRVTFADDGLVLLETLQELHERNAAPDVVVLDLQMPRLDGYDTLARIRANPTLSHLPVVIFSNSTQPGERRRSLNQGAQLHIAKPSTYEELRAFVDSLEQVAANATAPATANTGGAAA